MFKTLNQQYRYIEATYPEVTDRRMDDDHWDLTCTNCKIVRGFQVTQRGFTTSGTKYSRLHIDLRGAQTLVFKCPVCGSFKQWIVYQLSYERRKKNELGAEVVDQYSKYFRVASVPAEGLEEIEELPNDPPALREAYRQGIRAMDANAPLAAAAMFRRALQAITRDLLGAKRGNLANELKEVVGKSYNGGTIQKSFADVGYVIKEAGNQASHPDADPDLLDFTPQDAEDLRMIFLEVVTELFVIPAATAKAREDFLSRRKIKDPKSRL
jgi:hypothetical protein